MVLLAVIFIAAILCVVLYARWNYGVLESLKIPVDNCSFLLGSTGDMHLKIQHYEDIRRFQKLGGIYGIYEGRQPTIFVCDPELIRLIFVKDVSHFEDRRAVDLGDPVMNEMMDFLPYKKWKPVRHAATPAFTSSKIKKVMTEEVQDCINEFLAHLKLENQDAKGKLRIDCRKTFMPFFIDLTSRGMLGVRLNDPFNFDNKFTTLMRQLQGEDETRTFMYSLSFSFPILTALAPFMSSSAVSFFKKFFSNVIRDPHAKSQDNYLGRLKEMLGKVETQEYRHLKISQDTVFAQAFNAFLAGFDGMTTTLTFLFHYLATNPEIQERLQSEIDSVRETGDELNYDNVGKLEYLSACVKETLRLVPPFIRSERICTKDWEHNGLKITKGCVVMIPSWAANRNPEVYHNPDEFNPDRFLFEEDGKASNPYSFTTFGFGPRNCIGSKFAMDAMKLAVANILHEFEFKLCDDTEIVFQPGIVFFVKYKSVYLSMESRN